MTLLTFNKTLGVWTFNVPAGIACPNATEWCSKNCYAKKGNFLYKNVKEGQLNRMARSMRSNFVELMIKEVKKIAQKGHKIVRVHSCGDFYSKVYIYKWEKIALACPEVTFYAYTRNWRMAKYHLPLALLEKVSNFVLWFSTDPTSGIPQNAPRISYILEPGSHRYHKNMPKPNCKKQRKHNYKNCTDCGICTSKKSTAVTFIKH